MDTIKTEFELAAEQSAESLWEEFEKTGSVKTYLLFLQKTRNNELFESVTLPVLS